MRAYGARPVYFPLENSAYGGAFGRIAGHVRAWTIGADVQNRWAPLAQARNEAARVFRSVKDEQ